MNLETLETQPINSPNLGDCLVGMETYRDFPESDRYWRRTPDTVDRKIQWGEPTPDLQLHPPEYEPLDVEEQWYDALEKCDPALLMKTAEVAKHQATQEALRHDPMRVQDHLVACRILQQYESRQISLTDHPTGIDVLKKRMRRYATILAEEDQEIRTLTSQRIETLIDIRQVIARKAPIAEQHEAVEVLERGFYTKNLYSIHKLLALMPYYGAFHYGLPFRIKD